MKYSYPKIIHCRTIEVNWTDNAFAESFMKTIKKEEVIYRNTIILLTWYIWHLILLNRYIIENRIIPEYITCPPKNLKLG